MRPERLYLAEIVAAADAIARFLHGVDREKCLQDDLLQSAILQKFIVMGEAAAHLSDDFRSQHPEIVWSSVIGLRNVAVHQYFSVSWDIIWVTGTQDVPLLRKQVAALLAAS